MHNFNLEPGDTEPVTGESGDIREPLDGASRVAANARVHSQQIVANGFPVRVVRSPRPWKTDVDPVAPGDNLASPAAGNLSSNPDDDSARADERAFDDVNGPTTLRGVVGRSLGVRVIPPNVYPPAEKPASRVTVGKEVVKRDSSEPENASRGTSGSDRHGGLEGGEPTDDVRRSDTSGGDGRPPLEPPDGVLPLEGQGGEDDKAVEAVVQERRAQIQQVIANAARLTYGPEGRPLRLVDTGETGQHMQEADALRGVTLTDDMIVGRTADVNRVIDGMSVSSGVTIYAEEVLPLIGLSRRTDHLLPLAQIDVNIACEPEDESSQVKAEISLFNLDFALASVSVPTMNEEQGLRLETLLHTLGLDIVIIPNYRPTRHIPFMHTPELARLGQFVREL